MELTKLTPSNKEENGRRDPAFMSSLPLSWKYCSIWFISNVQKRRINENATAWFAMMSSSFHSGSFFRLLANVEALHNFPSLLAPRVENDKIATILHKSDSLKEALDMSCVSISSIESISCTASDNTTLSPTDVVA